MPERRRIIRWQINRQARLKLEGAYAYAPCTILDLNFKGAKLSLGQRLQIDKFFKINLMFSEEISFNVEVWVVWHKRIMESNVYGLYFTKIKDLDKEKIYKFVYKNFPQQLAKQWWRDFIIEEKGGEEMEDKRIFSRFKAELPLRFLDLKRNKEVKAQTLDISAKGIGFLTNEELAVHTPLEMWLQITDRTEALYIRGEVVWSKRLESDQYRVGVDLEKAEFMALSPLLRTA